MTGSAEMIAVEVACALPDTEVEVSWPQMNAEVPGDVRLVLEDLETGRKVYMRTSNGYRFRTGADGAIRHLRVSTAGGGQTLAVQSMSAQSTAGAVMITYSLAAPAEVSVEIINIAGRLIRQYAAREVDGGTQETLSWNGVSDRGSAVPSGRNVIDLPPLSSKVYISFVTISVDSPTPRTNNSVLSKIGVRISLKLNRSHNVFITFST